jgi:cytochrome c-type biogenesis protein CcmH/NrfF
MIESGKTDRQILDSFIDRYGQRILTEPEGTTSLVLTVVPVLVLMCGGIFLGWFLLRPRGTPAAPLPRATVATMPDSDWE